MNLTKTHELANLRAGKGLTLREVAAAVGTDDGAVSRWERSETEPHPEFRDKYAKALGITVEELGRIVYAGRRGKPSPIQVNRQRRARVAGRR